MPLPEVEYHIPPGVTADPVDLMVVLPYVDGMLREETMAALHASDLPYLTQPIDPNDPGDYAGWLRNWWQMPMDLVVLEQDMVPTAEQFAELARYPADWVVMPYHVGNGQYATGLGFCKLTRGLRQRHPEAGRNASLDPRNSRDLINWISLNENLERHLTRLGELQTRINTPVRHLHYPETADAAG